MDIENTPKIPMSFQLLAYPSIALALGLLAYTVGAGGFLASVIGVLATAGLILFRVFIRLISFRKFLAGFGEGANPSDHKAGLNILGVVPFSSKAVALNAAPTANGILVSRLGINRFIGWEIVSEVRNISFMGNPVLEITLNRSGSPTKFHIPWNKEANEYIPESLNS
ncbi:hypothetical protein ACMXYN_08945 [Neptuniibacter sp. PT8_73]|uniref:hypothetical protein n=1 Tax=unclassified Neptuniibacter TaxID=2630693 RepID=UPI0039F67AF8